MNLPKFKYSFLAGPLPKDKLELQIIEGNCRLAVQIFFYKMNGFYFEPEAILNPNGYKNTDKFIFTPDDQIDFKQAIEGDIIYAENRVNKKGEMIDRSKDAFKDEDDWIVHFHTAVYVGNNTVWHATNFEENSCFWTIEKFKEFYKPVALKRFLN